MCQLSSRNCIFGRQQLLPMCCCKLDHMSLTDRQNYVPAVFNQNFCQPCPTGYTSLPGDTTCTAPPTVSQLRRNHREQVVEALICPSHLIACSLKLGPKRVIATCIPPSQDLETCGGCPDSGGVDCSALDPYASARCVRGKCVLDCPDGFKLKDMSCIRN